VTSPEPARTPPAPEPAGPAPASGPPSGPAWGASGPAWGASGPAWGASGPAWGASGLVAGYRGVRALAGVTLWARPGTVTAVAGGDGAGKSTLLRCLAGAKAPDSGELRIPPAQRVGYLPAGSGTYPDLTVAENLEFRAAAYGLSAKQLWLRAGELLERAGLAGARARQAGQLSGGMRQKLGLVAALVHRPDLLVLDEPSNGVDPVSRSDLWWLIAAAAAGGAAVVLATSYLDEAERAGWVLVLDSGRELAAGAPQEIAAAVPGSVWQLPGPPWGARKRAWRRNGAWRLWLPPGHDLPAAAREATRIDADLTDAVTVAALARAGNEPAEDLLAAVVPALASRPARVADGEPARVPGGEPARVPGGEPARSQPLAECVTVTRRFAGLTAVRSVNLRVAPGEIVGLLGANGAGKTTLIRILLGLLPPSSGTVRLFGEPPSRAASRRIGYLPQGLGLYDDLSICENLEFTAAVFGVPRGGPGHCSGAPGSRAPGRGGRWPARGPGGRAPVGQLPLGVARRAAFAAALAHLPELLVLDEPTSGVDPLGRARLWEAISAAAHDGTGVLVTTHHLDEAGECSRLVVMAGGSVVAEGTAAGIIGDALVTVVDQVAWAEAFARLAAAGLPVALAGRAVRVPGTGPGPVRAALGDLPARVRQAPATLEERFFQLTLSSRETADAR
jgi:ABC-2 type transport system ATP-binding protein